MPFFEAKAINISLATLVTVGSALITYAVGVELRLRDRPTSAEVQALHEMPNAIQYQLHEQEAVLATELQHVEEGVQGLQAGQNSELRHHGLDEQPDFEVHHIKFKALANHSNGNP